MRFAIRYRHFINELRTSTRCREQSVARNEEIAHPIGRQYIDFTAMRRGLSLSLSPPPFHPCNSLLTAADAASVAYARHWITRERALTFASFRSAREPTRANEIARRGDEKGRGLGAVVGRGKGERLVGYM